jgi:hypothetical protein
VLQVPPLQLEQEDDIPPGAGVTRPLESLVKAEKDDSVRLATALHLGHSVSSLARLTGRSTSNL